MKIKLKINSFLLLFLCFLSIELWFHYIGFGTFDFGVLLRIIAFNGGLSLLLTALISRLNEKTQKILLLLFVFLAGVYSFGELEFKRFLDNYYSFAAASDGLGRTYEYFTYFMKDALFSYYLSFLPAVLLLVCWPFYSVRKNCLCWQSVLIAVLCLFLSVGLLPVGNGSIDIRTVYAEATNTELLLNKVGLNHFLAKDILHLILPEHKKELVLDEPSAEPEIEVEERVDVNHREMDDTLLNEAMNQEQDETMRTIDQYIMNQKTVDRNEYTGIFEDYNFIYVLVESLDFVAIDEQLTPTLYKMMNEGYYFDNHYTPKYSCTTGESEFIALTSLTPYNDVCTPNVVPDNSYPQALPNLFKQKGYDTYSFHNWYDQYYDRRKLHESVGFDSYHDYYDLDIQTISGWQSDLELVEKAYPIFSESDRYFAFLISSAMHWPYDVHSTLGDRYLDEVKAVHPDYPLDIQRYLSKSIDFDKGMEKLMDLLEEDGTLNNTVICIFADHHPFKLADQSLIDHTMVIDRHENYGEDKTPFIIYNPTYEHKTISTINSTYDFVPTLANMFNLNFDGRLYNGTDVMVNDSLVIFSNSDWINRQGTYLISNGEFIPRENETADPEMIRAVNQKVSNAYRYSYAVMDHDYFKNREFFLDPKEKKNE